KKTITSGPVVSPCQKMGGSVSMSTDGSIKMSVKVNNLAAIYESTNRGSEAVQLYKEALAIYERASGPAPSRAAEVRQNLQRLGSKQT
ncbi:MAG: tetratricopeptide repeat protein, partial [Acidobacteria bacterium]|nr:tetratricopeptide repeat protein [Acidobacteriota bacterium]